MAKYLGETLVSQNDVEEFKSFNQSDWAMYFIEGYGQIDGEHHKLWVLDQVAQLLKGTPVVIKLAKWDDGSYEYRVSLSDEQTLDYLEWRKKMLGESDEAEQYYEYDEGCAP